MTEALRNTPREIEMYRALSGSRIAEQAIVELNESGVLHDHHAGLGHEGIAIGVGFALRHDDCAQPSHRSGMMLAHARGGLTLREAIFNELDGTKIFATPLPDRPRVVTKVGLIGSSAPMAVGVAMADRLRGKDSVTVTFFGDGGANEGAIHEAMNLAGSRRLPIVFILENNGVAISMSASDASAASDLYKRAAGYGMPGHVVDGNDPIAVREIVEKAVLRARNGEGPSLIEARVTRWEAHADGVPEVRSPEEIAEARRHDCVKVLREQLIANGVLSEAEAIAIEEECRREVEQAVREGLAGRKEKPLVEYDAKKAWSQTYAA